MATANRPAQETPSKKLGLDEPETDVKERPHNEAEAPNKVEEEEDLDGILDQIEAEIKKMGNELSEVYHQSLRERENTQKRLELEDRRRDLRKAIIEAHEDFQLTLKNKAQQEEKKHQREEEQRKAEQEQNQKRLAEERKAKEEAEEAKGKQTTENVTSSSRRLAEIQTELALSRSRRRLLDLEVLSDLELATFSLPSYSYLYPYRWYTPYRSLYLDSYYYPRLYDPYYLWL